MKLGALILPMALLLAHCDRKTSQVIYAPHEEGLTLSYENPQAPPRQRVEQRLQLRVSHVTPSPNGSIKVENVYTTLKGELSGTFLIEEGSVNLVGPDGRPLGLLFPKGFPDQIHEWIARGQRFRILGRAMAKGLEVTLPEDFNKVGIWVESTPAEGNGPQIRTFYLPDLGEVETQEYRNGQWISINKLVARGFTDAPPRKPS